MSPNHWRKFLKPRLKKIYGAAKNKGCALMTHSDGDITELYPGLIELGADISDPTQPEVMDIEYIKKEFGRDIVLFGGLGCQRTIPLGNPSEVVREAKDTLKVLGKGGKYIMGQSGSIPT